MILLTLIIPAVTCLLLYLFAREETAPWEYVAVFIPSIIATLISYTVLHEAKISDIQWYSEEIQEIWHEDPWNEYVHRTCYRHVRSGKTTVTIPYNCSYVRRHPNKWYAKTKNHTRKIPQSDYEKIIKSWNTPEIFVDMHRRYHTLDGDAQFYKNPRIKEKTEVLTFKTSYDNYFQGKESIYSIQELNNSDKTKINEYPEINSYYGINKETEWIGWNPSPADKKYLNWINSRSKNFRTFIIVSKKSIPKEHAELQRRYWKNGNSNEVVIYVCLNNAKIEWIKTFSWSEEPMLENYITSEILPGQLWNPRKLLETIDTGYKQGYWKPRNFNNYSYIDVQFGGWDYFIVFLVTVLVNVIISAWVITNEFKN